MKTWWISLFISLAVFAVGARVFAAIHGRRAMSVTTIDDGRGHVTVTRTFPAETSPAKSANGMTPQTRELSNFTKLVSDSSYDVELNIGPTQKVIIQASSDDLSQILTSVNEDTLTLGSKPNSSIGEVKVLITVPHLTDVTLNGSGDITINGLNEPSLAIDISGSGNVIPVGRVNYLTFTLDGSGQLTAYGLNSDNAKIEIDGSGSAQIIAQKDLDVDISGSGSVTYRGRPRVRQNISGSGSINSDQ